MMFRAARSVIVASVAALLVSGCALFSLYFGKTVPTALRVLNASSASICSASYYHKEGYWKPFFEIRYGQNPFGPGQTRPLSFPLPRKELSANKAYRIRFIACGSKAVIAEKEMIPGEKTYSIP